VAGAFWRFLERAGTQLVQLAVSVLLARLLSPSDFGTVALLGMFLSISGSLIDSGFGSAIIQRKAIVRRDIDSAFSLSFAVAVLLYAVLFFCAPLIAGFYEQAILVSVLRWSALSLIINAVVGVQNAVIAREMRFKLSFKIGLVQTLVAGLVGVVMALAGYGIWALVFSSLSGSAAGLLLRCLLVSWKPRFRFSLRSVTPLFSFGWKIMLSGLLNSFFANLYGLVIGKVYSPADLSFYNRGTHIPQFMMTSVDQTITSVSFPALAQLQHDRRRVASSMAKMISSSCYVIMPLMTLLGFCAKPIVLLVYGSKWAFAISYMQIACFAYALYPFHTVNLQAISAVGRSDIFLRLEVTKKLLTVALLAVSYRHGVLAIALVSAFVGAPLSVLINAYPTKSLFGYSLTMQIRSVLPAVLACGLLAVVLAGIGMVVDDHLLVLALSCSVGALVYVAAGRLLKIPALRFYLTHVALKVKTRLPRLATWLSRIADY
jgi:O-antigen/teichoic acid export membrane protein